MRVQDSTESASRHELGMTTALTRRASRESGSSAIAFPRPAAHLGVERRTAALGWLSLGLGAAPLLAPRSVARLIGIDADRRTALAFRALGVAAVIAGVRWLDAKAALDVRRRRIEKRTWSGFTARTAITINRSREEVYRHWRDFSNLPYFMQYLDEVRIDAHDNKRSHWRAKGPLGIPVEWDAEIVEDRPNELIAWRSVDVADVPNRGTVRFELAPGGRATEVHVEIQYYPPAGSLGKVMAKLFGADPGREAREDMRRLKQVLETGEVTRSDASIHRGMHDARPAARLTPQPTKVIS